MTEKEHIFWFGFIAGGVAIYLFLRLLLILNGG